MARPKPVRRPSKKAIARAARKTARLRPLWFNPHTTEITTGAGVTVNVDSGVLTTANTASGNVTILATEGATWTSVSRVAVESLDEGVTWHTVDALEPAVNRDGELVIGGAPCGRAPECMRAGSGVYRFEIEWRQANEEERAVWERDRAAQEAEREVRRQREVEEREKVEARAHELLLSHLTASQRKDLEEREGFWVTSQFGNRYWVTRRTAVRFDERGVALQRYCIHAVDPKIPSTDNALLRMLLLKCDEAKFLETANPGTPSELDLGGVRRRSTPSDVQLVVDRFVGNGMTWIGVPAPICLVRVNGITRPLVG